MNSIFRKYCRYPVLLLIRVKFYKNATFQTNQNSVIMPDGLQQNLPGNINHLIPAVSLLLHKTLVKSI